jgi:hypothetical protein
VKRRLVLILFWLIAIDQAVPFVLEHLERRHYEGTRAFRFENSDLFALGPLVQYLRDHPQHPHRRVVFFGNSMIFGYFLKPEDAVPAQFQKLQPDARVYNAAVNGQELGTSYLVAKDIIDSVDVLYVQVVGGEANPLLPSLIPVDDSDLRRFHLEAPNRVETRLESWLGRVWHLYADNYRLQAALFGTSTRVFVYMHKKDPLKALHATHSAEAWPAIRGEVSVRAPRKPGPVLAQNGQQRIKNDLAALARAHHKRVVFLEFEWTNNATDGEDAAFNAAYAPYAETIIVHVPPAVTFDGQHLVPASSAAVAQALAAHEEVR